jgi:hypothetical protein
MTIDFCEILYAVKETLEFFLQFDLFSKVVFWIPVDVKECLPSSKKLPRYNSVDVKKYLPSLKKFASTLFFFRLNKPRIMIDFSPESGVFAF